MPPLRGSGNFYPARPGAEAPGYTLPSLRDFPTLRIGLGDTLDMAQWMDECVPTRDQFGERTAEGGCPHMTIPHIIPT